MDTNIKHVWVGDLCYVVADEKWQILCNEMQADPEHYSIYHGRAPFYNKDKTLCLCGTAYGDGVYEGSNGDYPVDSGTLGVIWEDTMDYPDVEGGKFFCINVGKSGELPELSILYNDGLIEISVGYEVIETIITGDNSGDYDDDDDNWDDD